MSKRRDGDFLKDILEAIERVAAYTRGMTYEQFIEDNKTQDAVVRNLEVIGEAVKNLSGRLKKNYPRVPWKDLAGVRDKMIHHYFGINNEIVWTMASEEIPTLLKIVKRIKSNELPGG